MTTYASHSLVVNKRLESEPGWIAALNGRQLGETQHVDDQFFNGAIGGTSVTATGTVTWVQDDGLMAVTVNGQGGFPPDPAARVFALTPTSLPITIQTRWKATQRAASNNAPGVYFGFSDGDTTTDNIAAQYTYIDSSRGEWQFYHMEGTFAAPTAGTLSTNQVTAAGPLYVRAIWSATNTFEYTFSFDGIAWQTFAVATDTVTLTPTHFFVGAGNVDSGDQRSVAWDYIRVYESDLS